MSNVIKTTSRTYNTIIADIDTDVDLRSKPRWWKRIWAGVGDQINRMLDVVYNLVFLRTSFIRRAVTDLVNLIDYDMTPQSTSSGTQRFNIDPTISFPLAITKNDLAATTSGSVAVAAKRFEARVDQNFTPPAETFTADAGSDLLTVATVYDTGDVVRVSTTGTLPGGLSVSTNYWAIYISDTTIKLATSKDDAESGIEIDITSVGAGVHTVTNYALKVSAYQQKLADDYVIVGQSDGVAAWQKYDIPDINIIDDQISVRIAGDIWVSKTTLIDSSGTDKHYRIYHNSDNTTYIKFGNGTYGKIPAAADIEILWAVGGGADSNVFGNYKVDLYAGSSSTVLTTDNITDMTGGADEQTIDDAKNIAPLLLKARDRFVTVEDGIGLVLAAGGVTKVQINKNVFGLLTCQVLIVPSGGGLPSTALKDSVELLLESKTLLNDAEGSTIDVTVVDPTYVIVAPTSAFKAKSGYVFADVKPFYDLGWQLFFSEVTDEIIQLNRTSTTDARNYINTKFSTSFILADEGKLKIMIDALDPDIGGIGSRDFEETIQDSDIKGYLDIFIEGVDYLTISSPSFPIVLTNVEISTIGTVTTTEIP